jgi:hypothetical protein
MCVVALQVRAFSFAHAGLVAARHLHATLLAAVLGSPCAFFEQTPTGRGCGLTMFMAALQADSNHWMQFGCQYNMANASAGRILNRFSSDQAILDDSLPFILVRIVTAAYMQKAHRTKQICM